MAESGLDAPAPDPTADAAYAPRRDAVSWVAFGVAVVAIAVVAWACVTEWGGIVHGHPAYAILLAVTLAGAATTIMLTLRRRVRRPGWRRALRIVGIVLALGWIALMAWLRPYSAEEPAVSAMAGDATVTVTDSATRIVMTPAEPVDGPALLFQPGALVDPRAYAAVLRPIAEAGHTVVIAKQPLGIAFLALGALDDAREAVPDADAWIIGGHSLGGTFAAIQADDADADASSPAVGLLLYASYPAGDISGSLSAAAMSVSGSQDGLSTPAKIDASRDDLPPDTVFVVIDGASHAQFGDYGPQAGDGTPTISHDDARAQISAATLAFFAAQPR
ncbi:hypothetical protein GCM10022200_25030 [Microbacterium awajiense]|uniref:Alpha/beta hydrolase fold-5 domain-containing protein n=1 Tax=Microbacterium awajiense TaxID=415214 RepID=A0ABP7AUG3_9MICO